MLADINGLATVQQFLSGSSLERFTPEPANGLSSNFRKALRAAKGVVNTVDATLGGITGEMGELLAQQKEMQEQMMKISLVSNVMRTEHETKMAAVRNLRVA